MIIILKWKERGNLHACNGRKGATVFVEPLIDTHETAKSPRTNKSKKVSFNFFFLDNLFSLYSDAEQ